MNGPIQGAEAYLWGGYALAWTVLIGYAISLYWRLKKLGK